MNETDQARKLLELRENGVTALDGLISIKGRILFRFILIAISSIMYFFGEGEPIFVFIIGFTLGMFIQDYSWFQSIAKSWSFTKKMTDWSKVELLAKNDS